MAATHFTVGLDAGASKTLLLGRCDQSSGEIERRGPAANPHLVGVEASSEILAALIREAIRSCGGFDVLSVCAGVAGAGRGGEQEVLTSRLLRSLEGEAQSVRVEVVHDAAIALDAAYGGESGLIIIAGTGSGVFGRTKDGSTRSVGGWGHLLGDAGSGHAVGRAGLRAVAEAFDGGADTLLRNRLKDEYGIQKRADLIHEVYQGEIALQEVAPLVIQTAEAGDAVATNILATEAAKLADQVEWLLNQNGEFTPRVSIVGGMLENESYARLLLDSVGNRLPDWTVERLTREPAFGALRRARRLVERPTS